MEKFKFEYKYSPSGDQGEAIENICNKFSKGASSAVLLGGTGTGKSATAAWVIERLQKPTLIFAHNKTLAAQLVQEFRQFFPNNAVEYFVSYYDYYQPEAYLEASDIYIEKDASINKNIERLRQKAINSLLTRKDVIIIATVSCIYGIADKAQYLKASLMLKKGERYELNYILKKLIKMQYKRNDYEFLTGVFRCSGGTVDIVPSGVKYGLRLEFFDNELENIQKFDILTGEILENLDAYIIYPASNYISEDNKIKNALITIKEEYKNRLQYFKENGLLLEADRLKHKVARDIELLESIGHCSGIENYSAHIDGRLNGQRPYCLLDYFGDDFLTIIDESHISIPQIKAMYAGDRRRKESLINNGWRLESAKDNRPLLFEEFEGIINQCLYMSATPGKYEIDKDPHPTEQLIRPTGLLDPEIFIKPASRQIDDLFIRINDTIKDGGRVLVTTITKKSAEELTRFLKENYIKAKYIHSDTDTLDRVRIITSFRKGEIDCLIGVNLLREGLDIPEVQTVAILDADKEGFLRNYTSLLQTIGRAARNAKGKVYLYADKITNSIEKAVDETKRRRDKQMQYNKKHNIIPATVEKPIEDITQQIYSQSTKLIDGVIAEKTETQKINKALQGLIKEMEKATEAMEFDAAYNILNEINKLKKLKRNSK